MPYSAEDRKEIAEYEEQLRREWNKSLIIHVKKVRAIKKPTPHFPNTIRTACDTYFDLCEEDGVKPSVAGLSVALGVSRDTLLSWVRGEISLESADVVKEYFSLIEIFDETSIKDNRTNAVSGIFMMKNNHGYKDEVVTKVIDEREISNEEIERKYLKMHEIIEQPVVEKQPIKITNKTKPKKKEDIVPF